jgi:hypothetical protein
MMPGSSGKRRSSKDAGLNDDFKRTKTSGNKRARHEFASNGNSSGPALTKYLHEVTQLVASSLNLY